MKILFDAPKLAKVLREYKRVSGLDHATVLEKKGKQLSIELYKGSVPYVPTKGRILDECLAVFKRGGRLKTKFKDPGGFGVTFSHHAGPRSSSSARFNIPASIMAREIAWRQAHRFVTAASWLFRRWRPGARRARKLVKNNYKGSAVIVATSFDGPMYVEIQNSQDGAIAQDRRHGLVAKAIAQVTGDMLIYLARKHQQRAAQFNRANPLFR